MLTSRMGILVSNEGVRMATGFVRHRTTVAARVWTYCISSKVCCTKYAWDLRNSFSNCDGLVDTLSKIRRKPAKTCLLLSHTPCLLLGSVHIEGCRLQREGHAWHYLTRLFAQKCRRLKEFGLDGGILSPRSQIRHRIYPFFAATRWSTLQKWFALRTRHLAKQWLIVEFSLNDFTAFIDKKYFEKDYLNLPLPM